MGFVGRRTELDRVTNAVAGCIESGAGRAVFIEGPAGVGKTTLATALIEECLAKWPGLAVARGRCVQAFESGDPYLVFVNALRDLSDESTAGFVSRSTISSLLKELAPHWLQVVPVVGNLLSAAMATATEVQGRLKKAGAPSREALFVQYLELITRLARQSPLLLFLDDLHWADHASLALLSYLARGLGHLPVAIVGTLRALQAEHTDPALSQTILELEREDLALRVPLGELDPTALEDLLKDVLQGDVAEPLRRWVHRTAGGNPLFASELARLLLSTGGIVNERGEWQLTEAAQQTEVPRSAEAVIEKRLQRLAPEELNLLQYASVNGTDFDSAVLARLLGQDELEVLDALQPLERKHGLVDSTGDLPLPDGDIAMAFRFRHALVQTVLYRQVVGKRRILLHRKAGEALETLYGDTADQVAGRLARHFHEGRQTDRAHRFARVAADAAAVVFANWEAVEYLDIALKNAKQPLELGWVNERLGDIYGLVGHYANGIACYRAAHATADEAARVRIERKIATLERRSGLTPAPELAQRVRALLPRAHAPAEHCMVLLELTRLPGGTGATDLASEAVRIASTLEDRMLLAEALERLAVAHLFVEGGVQDAFPHLQRALEIAESVNDPSLVAKYHSIAGIAHAKLGHYADARIDLQEMLKAFERMGNPNGIGAACTNLGAVLLRSGLYDEAERMLDRARSIHERRDRATVVESLYSLAMRALLSGDLALALERYGLLLEHAREFQHWNSEAVAHAGMGLCWLEQGRVSEARQAAESARAAVAGHDHWFEDRDLLELFLARLNAVDGQLDAAVARLASAAEALRPRDIYLWARIELERARLLQQMDLDAAADVVDRVAEATAGIQSPPIASAMSALRERLAVA